MRKSLKLFFVGIFFCSSLTVWSVPLKVEDVVNSKYLNELQEKKVVSSLHNNAEDDYVLLPNCEYTNLCNSRKITKTKGSFPFVLEYLFLLDKNEIITKNKSSRKDIKVDNISELMRSISKMEGIKYYSNTNKKYKTLYEKAYMIDNLENRNKIADRNKGSTKDEIYYLIQDDASFGVTAYSEVINESENAIYAYLSNEDSLGLAFMKAINPKNLGVSIIAVDCGEKVVLYINMDANCKKYPNIENIMTDSLRARIEALKEWIVTMF